MQFTVNAYAVFYTFARLDILKDVLDDWMKQKLPQDPLSNATKVRRAEATRHKTNPEPDQDFSISKLTIYLASEGHDLLIPYQFMCEEALDTTFEFLAGILSFFGLKQPLGPGYSYRGHIFLEYVMNQ